MATFKAKVESFEDAEDLKAWAESLNFQEDPAVLERLEHLNANRSSKKIFLFCTLISNTNNIEINSLN